jgi:hypothetical protein
MQTIHGEGNMRSKSTTNSAHLRESVEKLVCWTSYSNRDFLNMVSGKVHEARIELDKI